MHGLLKLAFAAYIGLISAENHSINVQNGKSKKQFALIPDDNGYPHFVNINRPEDINITVTLDDFNVYFYNPYKPNEAVHLSPRNFTGAVDKDFRPKRKSVFCAHGWTQNHNSHNCRDVQYGGYLNGRVNMFIIDYSRVAKEVYTISVASLPELGKICGAFIDKLLDYYNLESKQIMLIGHGLGAQLTAHCASGMRQKPGEILGLDPAQPLFDKEDPDNCLGREDGDVVHILHTNKGLLGFDTSTGHADFYPNGGGMRQPGCGPDLFGICAHNRATEIYKESIGSVAGFKSRRCNSYEDFQEKLCQDNHIVFFGDIDLDSKAEGDYYFYTNSKWPFAMTGQ